MVTSTLPNRTANATPTPVSAHARQHYLDIVRGNGSGFGPTLARFGLCLAAAPYSVAIRFRNLLYDVGCRRVHRAFVPVISVGNLTVGGTGKTPCVEYIASFLRERNLRVAILSRGYGGKGGPNDEALVLQENLPEIPHLQGPDRVSLARIAVEEHGCDVLVLDDGFQHRRLARDLDLVLVDATCPWGHGHVLPRGLLREPIAALARAHAVLLTRSDQVGRSDRETLREEVRRVAPNAVPVETSHEPCECRSAEGERAGLELLGGVPVAAFCGLGNPDAFHRTLTHLGIDVRDWRVFPDHHSYTRSDVNDLENWAGGLDPAAIVVTTQKDLVKLRMSRLGGRPLWCLRVRLRVDAGEAALHELIDTVVARGRTAIPYPEGVAP